MKSTDQIIEIVSQRHQVKIPISKGIRPDKVDPVIYGHHASYVKDKVRIWGFIDKAGFEKFKKDYNLCE